MNTPEKINNKLKLQFLIKTINEILSEYAFELTDDKTLGFLKRDIEIYLKSLTNKNFLDMYYVHKPYFTNEKITWKYLYPNYKKRILAKMAFCLKRWIPLNSYSHSIFHHIFPFKSLYYLNWNEEKMYLDFYQENFNIWRDTSLEPEDFWFQQKAVNESEVLRFYKNWIEHNPPEICYGASLTTPFTATFCKINVEFKLVGVPQKVSLKSIIRPS